MTWEINFTEADAHYMNSRQTIQRFFLHKQDVKKQDVRKTGYISDQQTK